MLMPLQTAQTQREDYDKLTDLFTETGGFLKVVQIIEKRVPNCQEYTECVTEVFASLLLVFAVQTRFMNEGRACEFIEPGRTVHSLTHCFSHILP